jgi:hypothetical protein
MATIVFKLPPLPDPAGFVDSLSTMTDEEKLIQSMCGVAATASLLIPAWHSLLAAETAYPDAEKGNDYPRLVMTYFMREAMLDIVLGYIRKVYESERSLSTGTILKLLFDRSAVEALRAYATKVRGDSALSETEFNSRITILKLLCAAHLAPNGAITDPLLARVGIQTKLARHAANKRTAHITLDDYEIGLDDLHQLIKNALAIATHIQAILGKSQCPFDHAEIDRAAYDGVKLLFGCSHAGGLLTDDWIAKSKPIAPERTGNAGETVGM